MPVLPIRITGDPVLHAPAAIVTEFDETLSRLVDDLFETMDLAPGVGLAAPQVGVARRVFVYSYDDDDGRPWRGEVVNPTLWLSPTPTGEPDDELEAEGCLSVPGERFPLRRAEHARLIGVDRTGAPVSIEASGWRARILQHEYDHLDGRLYVDRLDSGWHREVRRAVKRGGWGRPGQSWLPGTDHPEG